MIWIILSVFGAALCLVSLYFYFLRIRQPNRTPGEDGQILVDGNKFEAKIPNFFETLVFVFGLLFVLYSAEKTNPDDGIGFFDLFIEKFTGRQVAGLPDDLLPASGNSPSPNAQTSGPLSNPSAVLKPVGWAFYGTGDLDIWEERNFKIVGSQRQYPLPGDKVMATTAVNLRKGIIAYDSLTGWTNTPVLHVIEENERWIVTEIKRPRENFVWVGLAPDRGQSSGATQ